MFSYGTLLVLTILVITVGLIIYKQIKNKKEGKTACSCGCSGCAMSDICHKNKT